MERIYPTIFGEVVPLTIASTICRRPTCRGTSRIGIVPRPVGVAVARRFLTRSLTGHDPDLIADAEVVLSELVTNAIAAITRATDGNPELYHLVDVVVQRARTWVHLHVTDPAPGAPWRKTAGSADEYGRGLAIVDDLAALWWVHSLPIGKTIHAVLVAPGVVLTQAEVDRIASGL